MELSEFPSTSEATDHRWEFESGWEHVGTPSKCLGTFWLEAHGWLHIPIMLFSGHWSLVACINLQGRHIVTSVKPRVGEIAPLLWQAGICSIPDPDDLSEI